MSPSETISVNVKTYFYDLIRHKDTPTWPRWLNWMRRPTGDQEVAGSTPRRGWQHSFVETDHEIFSTVILSLPLIQEGQLSVSGECAQYWLTA